MSKLYYLASPYTSDEPGLREKRAQDVAYAAGVLIERGYNVFCPIAQSHYIAENSDVQAAGGDEVHNLWMRVDLAVLERSDALVVLTLDGFDESRGVAEEIEFARNAGMTIWYVDPSTIGEVNLV